jgi:AcrR family transcriptional regulator
MARRATTTARDVPSEARRRAPANSTRAQALSRDDIVDAALRWIDADGTARFSMRRFAASLEISGPALYWHFRSRDDLLRAAAERCFAAVDAERRTGEPWDDAVRRILTSLWTSATEHPGLLDVLHTQPLHVGSGMRVLQALLVTLREAGFPPAEAVAHTRALFWTTFGLVRGAVATLERVGAPGARTVHVDVDVALLDPDTVPVIADCIPLLEALDIDALFHHALDTMISGLGSPPRRGRRAR